MASPSSMEKEEVLEKKEEEEEDEGSENELKDLHAMSGDEFVEYLMDWLVTDPLIETPECSFTEEQIQEMSNHLLDKEIAPEDDLWSLQRIVDVDLHKEKQISKRTLDSDYVLKTHMFDEEVVSEDDVWSLQHIVEFHAKRAKNC